MSNISLWLMDKTKEEKYEQKKYGLADLLRLGTEALRLFESDDVLASSA